MQHSGLSPPHRATSGVPSVTPLPPRFCAPLACRAAQVACLDTVLPVMRDHFTFPPMLSPRAPAAERDLLRRRSLEEEQEQVEPNGVRAAALWTTSKRPETDSHAQAPDTVAPGLHVVAFCGAVAIICVICILVARVLDFGSAAVSRRERRHGGARRVCLRVRGGRAGGRWLTRV